MVGNLQTNSGLCLCFPLFRKLIDGSDKAASHGASIADLAVERARGRCYNCQLAEAVPLEACSRPGSGAPVHGLPSFPRPMVGTGCSRKQAAMQHDPDFVRDTAWECRPARDAAFVTVL